MSAAPSCSFLGPGAMEQARRAMRRTTGEVPALLIRWGGARPRAARPVSLRSADRAALNRLSSSLPEGPRAMLDGRLLVVDVPDDPAAASVVAELVERSEGNVGVAIGVPRCDAVDGVLRCTDEVVLIDAMPGPLSELARAELERISARLVVVAPTRGARWGGAKPRSDGPLPHPEAGQSTVVLLVAVLALIAVAAAFGMVASALGRTSDVQGRADVAALAGAKAMLAAQSAMYSPEPAQRISTAEYRRRGLAAAVASAEANDLEVRDIAFVGRDDLPTRIRVRAARAGAREADRDRVVVAVAEVTVALQADVAGAGDYTGPLAERQGQRMRPDVALAFDRLQAAATAAGHPLTINSAYRTDAEQARLFAAHPDPKMVAPPGKSLHRLGTELDLGPPGAMPWVASHATQFGFLQRYSWEAWHFGYTRSAGSTSLGYRAAASDGDGKATGSAMPSFVPAQYAPIISRASQRWSVGAALLGAQLWQESKFVPTAVSGAGAAGIAQFMPGTAALYGLTPAERFDPVKAIDAQAHLMHDLLRKFASVPLALAAYNAGEGNVAPCMCVPRIPETQGYVQAILALLGGAGLAAPAGLQIRLVA